jgi:transcriptional regulator with XRE-family HTH domain
MMGRAVWEACPAPPAPWFPARGRRPTPFPPLTQVKPVRDDTIGRAIRALRHRRGMRQQDLARRSGISRSVVADLEHGVIEPHTLRALARTVTAAGASLRVEVVVPGHDLRRLLDADHARIQSAWAEMLGRWGWDVNAEVTFNHFGERGSIDLLAWHEPSRVLVVVEVKTVIVDVQDLLAGLDRKARIALLTAQEGGRRAARTVPALVVAEGTTARRRVADHAPLFEFLELRGRGALGWLRDPTSAPPPQGILCLTKLPTARSGDLRRAGRARIRPPAS